MKKRFTGTVISTKMQKTVSVEITRMVPHPMYKRLMKKTKKFLADVSTFSPVVGQTVVIEETRPTSLGKRFKVVEIQ